MPSVWSKTLLLSVTLFATSLATALPPPAQLLFPMLRSEFATGLGPTIYDSLAQVYGLPAYHPPSQLTPSKKESSATIFFDYARDSLSVAPLLASHGQETTLFVPTNSAIMSLSRKPHQGPPARPDGEVTTYGTSREEEDAHKAYLERWVRRHVVASEADGEGEWKTMDGEGVAMRTEGKGWRVEPGNLGVKDVKEVSLVRRCWMRERS